MTGSAAANIAESKKLHVRPTSGSMRKSDHSPTTTPTTVSRMRPGRGSVFSKSQKANNRTLLTQATIGLAAKRFIKVRYSAKERAQAAEKSVSAFGELLEVEQENTELDLSESTHGAVPSTIAPRVSLNELRKLLQINAVERTASDIGRIQQYLTHQIAMEPHRCKFLAELSERQLYDVCHYLEISSCMKNVEFLQGITEPTQFVYVVEGVFRITQHTMKSEYLKQVKHQPVMQTAAQTLMANHAQAGEETLNQSSRRGSTMSLSRRSSGIATTAAVHRPELVLKSHEDHFDGEWKLTAGDGLICHRSERTETSENGKTYVNTSKLVLSGNSVGHENTFLYLPLQRWTIIHAEFEKRKIQRTSMFLRTLPWVHNVAAWSDKAIVAFSEMCDEITLPRNSILFAKHDKMRYVYLLKQGECALFSFADRKDSSSSSSSTPPKVRLPDSLLIKRYSTGSVFSTRAAVSHDIGSTVYRGAVVNLATVSAGHMPGIDGLKIFRSDTAAFRFKNENTKERTYRYGHHCITKRPVIVLRADINQFLTFLENADIELVASFKTLILQQRAFVRQRFDAYYDALASLEREEVTKNPLLNSNALRLALTGQGSRLTLNSNQSSILSYGFDAAENSIPVKPKGFKLPPRRHHVDEDRRSLQMLHKNNKKDGVTIHSTLEQEYFSYLGRLNAKEYKFLLDREKQLSMDPGDRPVEIDRSMGRVLVVSGDLLEEVLQDNKDPYESFAQPPDDVPDRNPLDSHEVVKEKKIKVVFADQDVSSLAQDSLESEAWITNKLKDTTFELKAIPAPHREDHQPVTIAPRPPSVSHTVSLPENPALPTSLLSFRVANPEKRVSKNAMMDYVPPHTPRAATSSRGLLAHQHVSRRSRTARAAPPRRRIRVQPKTPLSVNTLLSYEWGQNASTEHEILPRTSNLYTSSVRNERPSSAVQKMFRRRPTRPVTSLYSHTRKQSNPSLLISPRPRPSSMSQTI